MDVSIQVSVLEELLNELDAARKLLEHPPMPDEACEAAKRLMEMAP